MPRMREICMLIIRRCPASEPQINNELQCHANVWKTCIHIHSLRCCMPLHTLNVHISITR